MGSINDQRQDIRIHGLLVKIVRLHPDRFYRVVPVIITGNHDNFCIRGTPENFFQGD